MKKIIVLFLITFAFFRCGEEVEFNTPSFSAKKDGNIWEAVSYTANLDNSGVLTIVAFNNFETITLVAFPSDASLCTGVFQDNVGSCYEVVENASFATLLDVDEVFYSTSNEPDETVQVYPPAGVINLRDINLEEGVVSGEFYFNAFSNSGLSAVNFNEGFFHNVPLIGAVAVGGSTNTSCDSAENSVNATSITYNATPTNDPQYEDICNAYRTALLNKISSCGDPGGTIQDMVDALDCTATTTLTTSIEVEVDGTDRVFNANESVTLIGTTKTVIVEDAANTDYVQFDIEEGQTGTDIVTNFVININGVNHEPIPGNMTLGEFTTTITTNSNTAIQGTFSGAVNDYNGGQDVGLSMGVIDINY